MVDVRGHRSSELESRKRPKRNRRQPPSHALHPGVGQQSTRSLGQALLQYCRVPRLVRLYPLKRQQSGHLRTGSSCKQKTAIPLVRADTPREETEQIIYVTYSLPLSGLAISRPNLLKKGRRLFIRRLQEDGGDGGSSYKSFYAAKNQKKDGPGCEPSPRQEPGSAESRAPKPPGAGAGPTHRPRTSETPTPELARHCPPTALGRNGWWDKERCGTTRAAAARPPLDKLANILH